MADTPPTPTPGILLVHPRLHNPTPENASTFLKWTRLHFRDQLALPGATAMLRFTAPEDTSKYPKYSHEQGAGWPVNVYFSVVQDVAVLKSQAFFDLTRQLDLEKTRELGEGEEPVGKEGMVWDVVDAKFGVWEAVSWGLEKQAIPLSFQEIELPLSGKLKPENTHLILLTLKASPNLTSVPQPALDTLKMLQKAFPSNHHTFFASLYKHAPDAHPTGFPEIGEEGMMGNWMVAALVGDGKGRENVIEVVKGVVGGLECWKGMDVRAGFWKGEVFMS